MGFKDWFVDDKTGNSSLKVQCTGCSRITVVKIPSGKSFEKWNEKATCSQCNGINCWSKGGKACFGMKTIGYSN